MIDIETIKDNVSSLSKKFSGLNYVLIAIRNTICV